MFIRFITEFRNEYDEIETGIFQASAYLRKRSQLLYDYDKKHLTELNDWFCANLEAPNRFSKAKRKNPANVSLSWFRSTATEHLNKMYEMKEIIERYGIHITVIKRENPGYTFMKMNFKFQLFRIKKIRGLLNRAVMLL